MRRTDAVAFAAGVTFAAGLVISGMTQPAKVVGFLDVAGAWDPSLVFVMIGAIAVHFSSIRILNRGTPRFAPAFALPLSTAVDLRLIGGSAIFGVGWGIAGFCPGPALVSMVALAPGTLAFVGAMLAGMAVYGLVPRTRPAP